MHVANGNEKMVQSLMKMNNTKKVVKKRRIKLSCRSLVVFCSLDVEALAKDDRLIESRF